MNILFFDTGYNWIIVEIYQKNNDKITRLYRYADVHPNESSYRLISDISKAMKTIEIDQIDRLITCTGPGSFTGIRIAVSTARNLSQIWKVPVIGVDSLELYSLYYYNIHLKPILMVLDAKRKKVYSGLYDGNLYNGSLDIKPDELLNMYPNTDYCIYSDMDGHGYKNIQTNLPSAQEWINKNRYIVEPASMETYSYINLLPNYLRPSYAEDTNV